MVAAAVAGALGLRDGAPGEATPWAFRRLFAAVASERPLVLVFEDLHWADPPLLDLVEQLAARAPTRRCCCSAWPGPSCSTPAPAGPRGPAGGAQRRGEPPAARRARAPGRPRRPRSRRGRAATRCSSSSSPPTSPSAARPARSRRRCTRCSPRGSTCSTRPTARCSRPRRSRARSSTSAACRRSPRTPTRRRGRLDALVDRELLLPADPVVAGERAWRFRHALVHDAAYAALPLGARAEGHERIAGWLASRSRRRRDARIGAHLERAHAASAALRGERAPALAGRAAQPGWPPPASRRPPPRGPAGGDRPPDAARRRCSPATTAPAPSSCPRSPARCSRRARSPAARWWRTRRSRSPAASACRASAARAAVERERLRVFLHPETVDPEASLAVCRDAVAPLERMGDELGLARAHYLTCELVWLQGRSESGYRSAERVVRHARRAGSGFEIDTGVSYMAWAIVVNEIPVSEGIRRCDRLERMVAGRFAALSVRGFRAVLGAMAGSHRGGAARARGGARRAAGPRAAAGVGLDGGPRRARRVAGGRRGRRRAGARGRGAARGRDRRPLVPLDDPRRPRARGARAGRRGARGRGRRADRDRPGAERHASGGSSAPPRAAGSPRSRATRRSRSPRRRRRPPSPTAPRCSRSARTRTATSRVSRRGSGGVADAERAARTALALYAAKENVAGAAQVMQAAPSPPDGA